MGETEGLGQPEAAGTPPLPAAADPAGADAARPSATPPATSARRGPAWFQKLKRRAKRLRRQVWSLWLAMKDPRTPFRARLAIAVTVAYALSPIDLIPDFIPVLGYLDDLVILPGLIVLAIRLIPKDVMASARREAWKRLASGERVKSKAGTAAAVLFVLVWLAVIAWIVGLFLG
jgi:uncharacterized membrane protein YkvA (DUF1232 family)